MVPRANRAALRGPGSRACEQLTIMGFLDNLAVEAVRPFEAALHTSMTDDHAQLIDKLEKASKFDDALATELKKAIGEFKDQYVKDNANVLAV